MNKWTKFCGFGLIAVLAVVVKCVLSRADNVQSSQSDEIGSGILYKRENNTSGISGYFSGEVMNRSAETSLSSRKLRPVGEGYLEPDRSAIKELLEDSNVKLDLFAPSGGISDDACGVIGVSSVQSSLVKKVFDQYAEELEMLQRENIKVISEKDGFLTLAISECGQDARSLKDRMRDDLVNVVGEDKAALLMLLGRDQLRERFLGYGNEEIRVRVTMAGDRVETHVLGSWGARLYDGEDLPEAVKGFVELGQ
jgi:hypothetical protein